MKAYVLCAVSLPYLAGCSLLDDTPAAPTPLPSYVDEADRAAEAAEKLIGPAEAEADYCVRKYATDHAMASTAPTDILTAARGACTASIVDLRAVLAAHSRAAGRAIGLRSGGSQRPAYDAELSAARFLESTDARALDIIVRARTPSN